MRLAAAAWTTAALAAAALVAPMSAVKVASARLATAARTVAALAAELDVVQPDARRNGSSGNQCRRLSQQRLEAILAAAGPATVARPAGCQQRSRTATPPPAANGTVCGDSGGADAAPVPPIARVAAAALAAVEQAAGAGCNGDSGWLHQSGCRPPARLWGRASTSCPRSKCRLRRRLKVAAPARIAATERRRCRGAHGCCGGRQSNSSSDGRSMEGCADRPWRCLCSSRRCLARRRAPGGR